MFISRSDSLEQFSPSFSAAVRHFATHFHSFSYLAHYCFFDLLSSFGFLRVLPPTTHLLLVQFLEATLDQFDVGVLVVHSVATARRQSIIGRNVGRGGDVADITF